MSDIESVTPRGVEPRSSWRIGLFLGLAILGGRTAAEAQTPPGVGAADRPQAAATGVAAPTPRRATTATAAAAARRRSDPHFNRVVTTGRAPMSGASGAAAARRGPVGSDAMGRDDPFRPYSAGVRAADARAAMGSTRPQPPAARPPQAVQSSHNYYPTLRGGQHPNGNVAQVRRPQKGIGLGTGPGMGMGVPYSVPVPGGIPAGVSGRGR
jgi:hypothetical protein